MDSNKDEAARCVEIAKSALASGDKQLAMKFLRIARRLDPSTPIDNLLAASKDVDSSSSNAPEESVDAYSEEHVRVIGEIKKNTDYYAILGVEKSCSVEEIRKAYKKLSLKVHPDKNKAPGAEEAFKSVSKAFMCLSDDQSRRDYDQLGFVEGHELNHQHENPTRRRRRRRRRRAARSSFLYDENSDPDEVVRPFFQGYHANVFHAQQAYRARGGMASQHREMQRESNSDWVVGHNVFIFLQIASVLIFFLSVALFLRDPQYSLQKTHNYPIQKFTKHGVEYFVKTEKFDQKFPQESQSRSNLEQYVLRDYKSVLGQYCYIELQQRHWNKDYPTPHCNKLENLDAHEM